MKTIDMTGLRCGLLTVLGQAPSASGVARFHCLCDCGAARIVRGKHLRSGATQSCGCLCRARRSAALKASWATGRQRSDGKMLAATDSDGRERRRIFSREVAKSARTALTDAYVRNQLTLRSDVSCREIPQELVDLKREHLRLVRELKKE